MTIEIPNLLPPSTLTLAMYQYIQRKNIFINFQVSLPMTRVLRYEILELLSTEDDRISTIFGPGGMRYWHLFLD